MVAKGKKNLPQISFLTRNQRQKYSNGVFEAHCEASVLHRDLKVAHN